MLILNDEQESLSSSSSSPDEVTEFEQEMLIMETSCCILSKSEDSIQSEIVKATNALRVLLLNKRAEEDERERRRDGDDESGNNSSRPHQVNAYFEFMYLNNLHIKKLVLDCVHLLFSKESRLCRKIDILGLLKQLLAWDMKIEEIKFETETCRAELQPFFVKMLPQMHHMVTKYSAELKKYDIYEIKSFLRVLGYSLLCMPFSHSQSQLLADILHFIFDDLNLVSFRLTLCLAFNFFNQFDHNNDDEDTEQFLFKWNLLNSTHSDAIRYLSQNLTEYPDDYLFQRETFRICIQRMSHLSGYFSRRFRNVADPNKDLICLWLKMLVKDQTNLMSLLVTHRHKQFVDYSLMTDFVEMHTDLFYNLLEMTNIRRVLVDERVNGTSYLLELSKESGKLLLVDEVDDEPALQIALLIQMVTVVGITNRFDWSNDLNIPGTADFWELLIVNKWMPSGFELISTLGRPENRNAKCSRRLAGQFVDLIYRGFKQRLENKSYDSLDTLIHPQFLKATWTLVLLYDESELGEHLVQDLGPLLDLLGKVFSAVKLSQDMYEQLTLFYTNVFDAQRVTRSSDYWQKHLELTLIKVNHYLSLTRFEITNRSSSSTTLRVIENTINLLYVIKEHCDSSLKSSLVYIVNYHLDVALVRNMFYKNKTSAKLVQSQLDEIRKCIPLDDDEDEDPFE